MKLFGSSLFGQAIKAAGVGAALMLSVSAGHAQSGPFAGFSGAWSGNGTVSLSDGTTERIRCKADYQLAHGFVLDERDAAQERDIAALGMQTAVVDTIMRDQRAAVGVASAALQLAKRLA